MRIAIEFWGNGLGWGLGLIFFFFLFFFSGEIDLIFLFFSFLKVLGFFYGLRYNFCKLLVSEWQEINYWFFFLMIVLERAPGTKKKSLGISDYSSLKSFFLVPLENRGFKIRPAKGEHVSGQLYVRKHCWKIFASTSCNVVPVLLRNEKCGKSGNHWRHLENLCVMSLARVCGGWSFFSEFKGTFSTQFA